MGALCYIMCLPFLWFGLAIYISNTSPYGLDWQSIQTMRNYIGENWAHYCEHDTIYYTGPCIGHIYVYMRSGYILLTCGVIIILIGVLKKLVHPRMF